MDTCSPNLVNFGHGGPVIPCDVMHQLFTDALVLNVFCKL